MADFGSLYMTFGAKLDSAGFGEVSSALKQISEEQKGLKKAQDDSADSAKELSNVYRLLAASAVTIFLKQSVDEYRRAQQESYLLQQRVQGLGLSWTQNEKPLNKYLDTLEELTRFEKDDATPALNIMIDKTRDLEASQRLLVDAMGLSVATGMSLNEAASLVAGAEAGMQRDTIGLAKALGITRGEIKSNAQILEELHKRFGDVAISGDKMADPINRAGDSLKNLKETIGAAIIPYVNKAADSFSDMAAKIGIAVTFIADATMSIVYLNKAVAQLATGHIKLATASLGQAIEASKEAKKAFEQALKDYDEYTKRRKDISALDLGNIEDEEKKKRTMGADTFNALASIAQQSADVIGQATVKGLQGDVKAWRNAAAQIIDITIRQAQAVVMARAIEGAAAEVASKGVVGIATGMAAIAWGAAQVAVLAGLGQALKGLTGTESAGGAAGGGVGTASPTTSASAAAAQPQLLQVVINGDYVSDTQFAQDLAKRISGMVENRDLRLISSATVTNG